MARINFDVDEETHQRLKIEAAKRKMPMKKLFLAAVEEYLGIELKENKKNRNVKSK